MATTRQFSKTIIHDFLKMDFTSITKMSGHTKFVEDCSYSTDGSRLVSCSGDQTILMWDAQTGQKQQTIGKHGAEVWSCDFSKYGIYVCSASSDKTVCIWDQRSQGAIATFTGHTKTVMSCAFDPSWSSWRIASASSDAFVKIWNWKTLSVEQSFENHRNVVEHVTFSRNGQTLISCGRDSTVQIFEDFMDESKRKLKRLKNHEKRVNFCCFSCNSEELVLSCSDDKTIKVWDRISGENRNTIVGHFNTVWCCDTRPINNKTILVSCSSDKTLRFWDMADGTELKRICKMDEELESEDQLLCCRFSPDQSQLAVCSNNGNIYLLEMRPVVQEIIELFS